MFVPRLLPATLVFAALLSSCAPQGPAPSPESAAPIFVSCPELPSGLEAQRVAIQERSEARLARVLFLKPEEDAGIDPYLAPLFLLEEPANHAQAKPRLFGAVTESKDGKLTFDAQQRAIYHEERTVQVAGFEMAQHVFVAAFPSPEDGKEPVLQGVRTTYDDKGRLLVVEVLRDASQLRVLYVSSKLERDAATTFGAPLPGRKFAVEQDPNEHPDVVVAGILDDAPAPLGPYVYVCGNNANVSTVLCRCTSAQFDQITRTLTYALVPAANLPAAVRSRMTEWLGEGAQPSWLEIYLRWPKGE